MTGRSRGMCLTAHAPMLLARTAESREFLTGGALSDAAMEQLVRAGRSFFAAVLAMGLFILASALLYRRMRRILRYGAMHRPVRPVLPEGWALYSDEAVRTYLVHYVSVLWMEPRLPGLWALFPWKGRAHVLSRAMDAPDFMDMLLGAGVAARAEGFLAVRKDRLDEAAQMLLDYVEKKEVAGDAG